MTLTPETIERFDLGYDVSEPHRRGDGVELYYEVRGSGPPLCIVNNMYVVAPLWRNFTRSLVERHTIVAYDLRNQGASTMVEGELTLDDHVEDLRSLLDALEIERTYLVGTSISTLICRDFALAHPDRVEGLILCGPVFNALGSKRRKYLTRSWLRTLEGGGPRALFDHIYPLVFGEHTIETGGSATYLALRERFLALNSHEQLVSNLSASLSTSDDPGKLARIPCPTFLMAGESDFLVGPGALEATARLLPDASAEIIPFAGHVPYFEATDRFEQLVQDFVASVGAR